MISKNNNLKNSEKKWRIIYFLYDFCISWFAYTALYTYRKSFIEPSRFGLETMYWDNFYSLGAALSSTLWVFSIGVIGLYINPIRKSRLTEISHVIQVWFIFSIAYFFIFLLDDYVSSYSDYFKTIGIFSGILLLGSLVGRILLGYRIQHGISSKKYSFPTLIIGSRSEIEKNIKSLIRHSKKSGEVFVGWINTEDNQDYDHINNIPMKGNLKDIPNCIKMLIIEDCIVALSPEKHHQLTELILDLEMFKVRIFMIPDTYGILSGQVKIDEHGIPLLEWHLNPMNPWQQNTKRLMDIVISILILIGFFPIFLIISIFVLSSGRPILYCQKRLGKNRDPFDILKFRSMYVNAEKKGPQLSSDNDPRITPIGRVLRKYRLDELPQFWNVLKGDMSIVGPRPERMFFAQEIIKLAPQYNHIYKVRPGITSWGMVRYGYASGVDEMIKRMKFDLLYIENMSFFNDIKVLIYTVWTVIQGRGK